MHHFLLAAIFFLVMAVIISFLTGTMWISLRGTSARLPLVATILLFGVALPGLISLGFSNYAGTGHPLDELGLDPNVRYHIISDPAPFQENQQTVYLVFLRSEENSFPLAFKLDASPSASLTATHNKHSQPTFSPNNTP